MSSSNAKDIIMTDQPDDATDRLDADDTAGKTTRAVEESGSSGTDDKHVGKAQEDLDADDLKGFVKDPLEQ
ncbi:hypothetical protein MC45_02060 [Sphingomonas taxi]|uniref:Uncharacterized protein n=2 Tax=Sphingomonas taxi TaxID=1549858 RepID=A0A097ECV0_9SPHN|nr:hypothetical protein MC45_02060 [Sphingomonas taxi]